MQYRCPPRGLAGGGVPAEGLRPLAAWALPGGASREPVQFWLWRGWPDGSGAERGSAPTQARLTQAAPFASSHLAVRRVGVMRLTPGSTAG